MGAYINIGNAGFQRARNSVYVDKSELIAVVNSTLLTERCTVPDSKDREIRYNDEYRIADRTH